MEGTIYKTDVIKWLVRGIISLGISFVIFAYGMMIGRVEETSDMAKENQAKVAALEGDIKAIKESVKWLEKMKDEYILNNGKINMEDFLQNLALKQ